MSERVCEGEAVRNQSKVQTHYKAMYKQERWNKETNEKGQGSIGYIQNKTMKASDNRGKDERRLTK